MIVTKSLKKDGQMKLSEHFKAYEFSDTSPSPYNQRKIYSDVIKYSPELINKLEGIISLTGAKSVSVSSGYRSRQHDKDVGGSGYGQHPNGCAADVCFFDSNNKPIDNRAISIIAQDIGVKGIARINKNGYIHLDMRANGSYLGDETKGTYSVTKNFRQYYGLNDSQISNLIGKVYNKNQNITKYNGIDYSDVYNKDYYYSAYSDLRAVFGDNPEALIKHFVEYGMAEGRQACDAFNVQTYKNNYIDLRNAFGNDLKAYYIHYINYGKNEGRIAK